MARRRLRPFRYRFKRFTLPDGPPVVLKSWHLGRLALQHPVLQQMAGGESVPTLPESFPAWTELESKDLYVFIDGTFEQAEAVTTLLETADGLEQQPVNTLDVGSRVVAITIDKAYANAVSRDWLARARQRLRSMTPRAYLRSLVEDPASVDDLLAGAFWHEAERTAPNFFLRHGRRAVVDPRILHETSALRTAFAMDATFLDVAELVSWAMASARLFEKPWAVAAQSGFHALPADVRQHVGAAVGVIASEEELFPRPLRDALRRRWETVKEDRAFLRAIGSVERKLGGPFFSQADSGQYKSSRPLFTALIVRIVDRLLREGASKRKACELTDRLLLLLAPDWYDHRSVSWSRVRNRYDYAKAHPRKVNHAPRQKSR